ncbi:MAG: ATP-dependent Clp protease proteolytic subunit, partial [Chitinophagaceae bacterium]|nr:ATP-dependent Clp protease proteolytic subunit [Chitinophagaceae bacterium]
MNWSNVDTRWMEDDENENKEEKADQLGAMMMKKMDKLFFERRMVYLWGAVNDKSAREVVTKLMLLDADRPGEEIKFYINSPGGVVT